MTGVQTCALPILRCACYPSPVFYDALDDKVGLLKLIPGTPAAVLEFMLDRFDGLVIESFGVGGLPEYEGDASYLDRKSTRLNSSHVRISYAVFCLKKKKTTKKKM